MRLDEFRKLTADGLDAAKAPAPAAVAAPCRPVEDVLPRAVLQAAAVLSTDTRLGIVCLAPSAGGLLLLHLPRLSAAAKALKASEYLNGCATTRKGVVRLSHEEMATLARCRPPPGAPTSFAQAVEVIDALRRQAHGVAGAQLAHADFPRWGHTVSTQFDVQALRQALGLPLALRHVGLGLRDTPQDVRSVDEIAQDTALAGCSMEALEAYSNDRVPRPIGRDERVNCHSSGAAAQACCP